MESSAAQEANMDEMINISTNDSDSSFSSSSSSSSSSEEDSDSDESSSSSSSESSGSAENDNGNGTEDDCNESSTMEEDDKEPIRVETDCLPAIEELTIGDGVDCKGLAGEVVCTMDSMGVHGLVIKPYPQTSPCVLLDLGSPLFLQHRKDIGRIEWSQLGRVHDVFGKVTEPLYFAHLRDDDEDVRIGTRVYYSTGHPLTSFVKLRRSNHRLTLAHHSPDSPRRGNINRTTNDPEAYGNLDLYNYSAISRADAKQRYSSKFQNSSRTSRSVRQKPACHFSNRNVTDSSLAQSDQNECFRNNNF